MDQTLPLTRQIVLIGGGHTHALLLRAWGMNPLPGAHLTVINPGPTAPYTGMLPGFVAGHYTREELDIDLVRLSRFAGARLILGHATGIDRDARLIEVEGRPPVSYDYASFDIGITSDMPEIEGFQDHGVSAKPLGPFADRWKAHLDGGAGSVAVIGGGIAGVELALAMRHAMGADLPVAVIDRSEALTGVSDASASKLRVALAGADIELKEHSSVARVTATEVHLVDGRSLPSTLTVGAAGARPYPWLGNTGLTLEDGYIAVDPTLRSPNDERIFATGDCAHLTATPRPKAGVFAVRAAPILTRNLRAAAAGTPLKPFKPQAHYLKIVSLGAKNALADKWGKALQGPWVWTWKDRIDQRFMDRLNDLTPMQGPKPAVYAEEALSDAKPLCGGCGSKVGAGVLDRVLAAQAGPVREDVLGGAGDDAAILSVGGAQQVLTTDHLRAFWPDPYVFARITALHAMGDVWAMGATPQAVLTHVTLPQMSPDMQESWLSEIMAAATEVFRTEGAAIVGGHTTMGAELTLGFTITGTADGRLLTINGATPGDALVLTRPIGSGTLLAAEMQLKTRGDDICAALDVMSTSQGAVARALTPFATAMTDVTGFGLAGHAQRMAEASDVTLVLELGQVPVLPGALDLARAGVRSTIWPANRALVTTLLPDTPVAELIFDPQTSGGFLATIPTARLDEALKAVEASGGTPYVIGKAETPSETPLKVT